MSGITHPRFKYRAFISYSHTDDKWATWLHKSLESYRIPKHVVAEHNLSSNRLIPIFRDREDLASAGDLSATIKKALDDSENLIVVCSPSAAVSFWVNEEIRQFKQLGKADRVFCLLVDEAEQSIPPAALVDVDGDGYTTSEENEPLAADLRPDADGKQGAKLKLVASLLGIDLDRLRRREVQRRNRRMLTIATTATVGMIFSIGLAAYAFQQQQRAVSEAETSRQITEFLLSTFENADPQFYRGAEPSAGEILQQGALRVRHELQDRPEIRARLMATIGSAFLGLTRSKEAEELLREALELQERQFGKRHIFLVSTLQDLASARGNMGDEESVNRMFARAIEIQEELGSNVAIADSLLQWSRQVKEGEPLLLRSLAILEIEDPESKLHSRVLQELAHYQFDRGDLEKSLDYHQAAADIQEAIGLQEELIFSLAGMGGVLAYLGKSDQSLSMQEQAVALSEEVYGMDHPYTGTRLNDLAVQHHLLQNFDKARPLYQRALATAEDHLGPQSGLRRIIMINLGELERDRGAYPEAETLFVEAARVYRETSGKVPAYLTGQIALLLLAQKRHDEAEQQFDRYFTDLGDDKPSQSPAHVPIIEGYEQLLREIGQAQE